jgi:hypothetical protein
LFAGIFVVMQLIVLGIEQMNSRMDLMKAADLLIERNKLMPFFGIAGNRETGDRKLNTPLRLNGRCDNGIVSEDLFYLVGIGRLTPNSNTGSAVVGKLWATKPESIGRLAYQR